MTIPGHRLAILALLFGFTPTIQAAEGHRPSVEAALQAYQSGSLHQALKGFLHVLAVDPKNPIARRYVSMISRELANQRGAKLQGERGAMLDRAKRVMAEQEELFLQSQQALEADDPVSAIERLWRAQELDPSSEKAKVRLARLRQRLNAVAAHRESAPLGERLRVQGVLHYLNRDWHLAVKSWREALPHSAKGERLRQDIAKADRYLQATLQRERAELLVLKGKDHFQQGQRTEAKAVWEEALRLAPGYPEALQGLSQLAKEEAQRAEQTRQEELDRHFGEALEFYARGRYAESRKEWEAVLALNPDHPTAKEYLAKIEERLGQKPQEKPHEAPSKLTPTASAKTPPQPATVAIPAMPVNPSTQPSPLPPVPLDSPSLDRGWKKAPRKDTAEDHYQRGLKEQTAQRPQEAIREFEKALKTDPTHPHAVKALQELRGQMGKTTDDHYKKGLIAYSQGRRAEAIKEWRMVLAIDPHHAKAKRALLKAESEGNR